MAEKSIAKAIAKVGVALEFGTASDYTAENVVGAIKELCVNAGCAPSVDAVRANGITDALEFFADNYGSEIHEPYDLIVTPNDSTVTVKRKGKIVAPGADVIYDGDKLIITVTANTGHTLEGVTLNGYAYTPGTVYTVNGGPVEIVADTETIKFDLERTAENATILVKNGEMFVNDGTGVIAYGNELIITATADSGYVLGDLLVNGETIASGDTVTVTGNVTITCTATQEVTE